MAAGTVAAREGGEDAFRQLFRFYRRWEGSDAAGVIDFSKPAGRQVIGQALPARAVLHGAELISAGLHGNRHVRRRPSRQFAARAALASLIFCVVECAARSE